LAAVKATRGSAEKSDEMTRIGKPMLFCPPHPPVALGPRDTVSIGRSRGCDLRLPGGDASRRHAEIAGGPDGFTITDLGSTNGTFVNDQRIQKHELQPGDRVEIGNSMITFCQVGGGLENIGLERELERTIQVERPTGAQVFEGELAEIPPFALLQILEMGSKSGLLSIEADQAEGRLWLANGAPIHAETKRHSGFDAAVEIVNFTGGRFTFQPREDAAERTILASVTELLLEASRILDEGLL
jgi:pSer/pThr/pTyr-binding forkhead associated (FHA) protein